jgi:hypothetical protein
LPHQRQEPRGVAGGNAEGGVTEIDMPRTKTDLAKVRRIYRKLKGARGMSEEELWRQAWFLSLSPEERCRESIESSRRAGRTRFSRTYLPIEPPPEVQRLYRPPSS